MKRNVLAVLVAVLSTFVAPISRAQPQQAIPGKPTSSANHILNCMRPLGHHLYEQEHVCPVGGERFRSLALGTHSTFGRHLDWKPISYMDFPAPVPVCPGNGFVVAKENYSEEELKKYTAVIESEAYKSIYRTQHPSYYILAKFQELAGEGAENRWWHLLQATWEADSCLSDRYSFYADEAIAAAEARLPSLKPEEPQYWVMHIVISELYRRTSRFDLAGQWLGRISHLMESHPKAKQEYGPLIELQRGAIRDRKTMRVEIDRGGRK